MDNSKVEVMEGKEKSNKILDFLFGILKQREAFLIILVAIIFVVMGLTNKNFLKWTNISTIITSLAIDGIVVIGMTIILISGGIDLAVGSTLCLCITVAGWLMKYASVNPWLASLVGIGVAALYGLILGVLVTKLHLTHFIVSLCFMGISRGLVQIITQGQNISLVSVLGSNPAFAFLGQGNINIGSIQFPMAPVTFIIIAIVTEIYVRNSAGMRRVYYTGSNENAARYSGIKIDKVKILACVACAVLAGVAGIIHMIRFMGAATSAGTGKEMTALSAAVIGGASMNGGRGTIIGSILGLLFIILIQDAMTLSNVQPYYQEFVKYMIVLLAVSLDGISLYRANAKKK